MGIRGVTISDVRGFGAQGGLTERQAGKCLSCWVPESFVFNTLSYCLSSVLIPNPFRLPITSGK